MVLRIATWNVNSVRARVDAVAQFIEAEKPDILCMQEIKVADHLFPVQAFADLGYPNHCLFGQKAYHGVATFAREGIELEKPTRRHWCEIEDARHLHCVIPGGIELHNFYIPAGGDNPDAEANPKFAHKLQFMTEVADWFRRRKRKNNRFILLGDLNVAPHENDVWSHKQLLKVVSHTPIEVEHMARMYQSHDWIDAVRQFTPEEEKLYTWWSYRSPDWRKADKGRRLDHIWVTPALAPDVKNAYVHKDGRAYKPATDHAPVIVDVEI